MNRKEKEDLIIRLYNEGKTWDIISHEAGVSFGTIKKVLDNYEETQAFELFAKGYSPNSVKIELGIPAKSVEKHYLAFMKLVRLVDLSYIYNELGDLLPDFVTFYKSAKSYKITPHNMDVALRLATSTSILEQENIKAKASLDETKSVTAMETQKLIEIQGNISRAQEENLILVQKRQAIQSEIELLNSVLDKIKNTPDNRKLKELIWEAVNSISSEQYFAYKVSIIAIMKLIQKDPTLIPLFQFPVPDINDMTPHTEFYQSMLIELITKTTKLMPYVLEELATLTGKKILPQLQNLETLYPNSESPDQHDNETTLGYQSERHTELKVHPEVSEVVSSVQDEKRYIPEEYVLVKFYINPYDPTDYYAL